MDKNVLDPNSDTSEKSSLTVTDIGTACNHQDTSLKPQTPAENKDHHSATISHRPDSLCVATDLSSQGFNSGKSGACVEECGIPSHGVLNQLSKTNTGTDCNGQISDRYCTLAESSTGKTASKRNIEVESESGLCTTCKENSCCSVKSNKTGEDHQTLHLDRRNLEGASLVLESLQKDRGQIRSPCIGEYCLASPINDLKESKVASPSRKILPDKKTSKCYISERIILSKDTPVIYANYPNGVAYPATQLSPAGSFQPGRICTADYRSRSRSRPCQNELAQNVEEHFGTKHEDTSRPLPVVQQVQTECSTCSCLGSLNSKTASNQGTSSTIVTEPINLKENRGAFNMESLPSSRSNNEPTGRYYYNSGSALLKPLMKRMSMLAKSGAFKNWVSTGEKSSKPGKGKTESKTSDKDCNRTSASENEDAHSTLAGLDLSLPPRFSQIDSCPRHPVPSLPPPHQQNLQSSLHHHDHSFGYPQPQQRLHHYLQNHPGNKHPEREVFINLHHPQQERYVLHQSCSGFSLGHSLHSPNSSQLPPSHPNYYPHHLHTHQQHQQQQWQLLPHYQHQQQQQQQHQFTRRLSSDSMNSLLQTVKCGRSRYRISPVSLLWTFLSVLLASACALSLATPCWMVHPDHIHSFGLFNLCVRDRRFALPRPLCMSYSEMTQWGVPMPSSLASSSYPSYSSLSSYASSNPSSYHRDIPKDSSEATSLLRRKRSRSRMSQNENEFRSSLDSSPFRERNSKTENPNNVSLKNTYKHSETIDYDSEILPFHRSNHFSTNRRNRNNKDKEDNLKSPTTTTKSSIKADSAKAKTSPQRSTNERRLSYSRGDDTNPSGLYSIPSVAWQAAFLLFGAGVCVQILGAVISIVILVVSDPLHRRLATANGFLQTAGVFLLASGLLLYPAGFGSHFYRYYCGADGAFESGRCHMGWSYVIAVMATALSVFCPVMSSFAEAQQKVKASGSSGGGAGGGGDGGAYKQAANTEAASCVAT